MSVKESRPTLLQRRQRSLAAVYRLFYEPPLHIASAYGAWLTAADGTRYLDAYNNVPVLGHGHPEVVQRVCDQARLLNTHTRYLTEAPVELAERLLATMPPAIDRAIFTCTGSEANDLAVRIAKAATGGTGFLVTECAYHGTTGTLAGMSPVTGAPTGAGVFTVPVPLASNDPREFGVRVRSALDAMQSQGVKPAALLVDTIFGSDGVVADPPGFLRHAQQAAHDAGALFIADEVQPGFGRTGGAMWGFMRHGISPDIVTMGKPMGNGFPVAALVASEKVIGPFAELNRYFNTFGGSTVACAAALAVLDILQREALPQRAQLLGTRLKSGLESLAAQHQAIVAVRGSGLFLGVQLATPELARQVVSAMRNSQVLIGTAGRVNDTLKIRPPLVIAPDEVDLLVATLDHALQSCQTEIATRCD